MLTLNTSNLIYTPSPISEETHMIKESGEYIGFEYSFMSEALAYTKRMREEQRNRTRILYKAIAEAETEEVVTEAFSDFFNSIGEILHKFFEFLKSLLNRFITNIMKITQSDKYLINKKDLFNKFDDTEHEFSIERYNYTYINDISIPASAMLTDFAKEDTTLKSEFDKIKNGGKGTIDFTKELNKFRYQVIHPGSTAGSISSSDFNQELFDLFRDGGNKDEVFVRSSDVTDAYRRFADYKDTLKSVKETKTQIEDDYKTLKQQLADYVKIEDGQISVADANGSYTVMKDYGDQSVNSSKYETIVKKYVDKISQMTTIHGVAFSAKLDAITECYKADKKLLYRALSKIQKTVTNESTINVDDLVVYDEEGYITNKERDALNESLDRLVENTNYHLFLAHEALHQDLMINYINNEILSETGYQIMPMNEAAGDKIKTTISRVLAAIAKAFGKFKEFFAKVFKSDKDYLEKYKTIILRKKPIDAQITMNDYIKTGGLNALVNMTVPQFEYNSLKSKFPEGEEPKLENYIKQNEPYNKFCKNTDISVAENFVDFYSGDPVEINSQSINMTDIFNYIYGFDSKTFKAINRDIETVNKEKNKALQNVTNQSNEISKAASQARKEDTGQGKKNGNDQEGQTEHTSSTIMNTSGSASLLETLAYYFNEDFSVEKNNNSSTSSTSSTPTKTSTPSQDGSVGNNIQNMQKDKDDDPTARRDANEKDMIATNTKELERMSAIVDVYFTAVSGFLTGKLNFSRKVYNDYFKLIRWHVQQFNGDKGKEVADKATQGATDYRPNEKDGTGDIDTGGDIYKG